MSKINDDLMRVRLSVPEPTWVDVPYWKFMWPLPPITFFDCGSFDPEVTIETESLERKKFYEEGVVYSAWTYDMSELEKLRLKLAELEEAIALARGDSCRADFRLAQLVELKSGCLKAIAQLTLVDSVAHSP